MSASRRVLIAAAALAISACAPPLSTFQTARIPPKGTTEAVAGFEASLPVGTLSDVVQAGKDVAAKGNSGQSLTADEKWQLFDAGTAVLLSPPSFGYHFMLAYVPTDKLEIGLRYAGGALRLGARYQLLTRENGPFDMNAGIGIARFGSGISIINYVPGLEVGSFSRWQIDVPVLIGTQNRWFRAWTGPRFVATFFDASLTLDLRSQAPTTAAIEGHAYYLGGQGGVGVGYRWLFVAFEMTLAEMLARAYASAPAISDAPTRTIAPSGFVIYPSVGLMGEF